MRVRVAAVNTEAESLLPPAAPDGSKVGVNYVDAYVSRLNVTLDDGLAIACKRRGIEITLRIGERSGSALLRRLEHGPDARAILRHALEAAAAAAGASFAVEDGVMYLDL
jgi:hypothetical protein